MSGSIPDDAPNRYKQVVYYKAALPAPGYACHKRINNEVKRSGFYQIG